MPAVPLPAPPGAPPKPPMVEVHSPFTDSLIVIDVAASTEFDVLPRASTHLPAWIAVAVAVACLVYVVLDETLAVTDLPPVPEALKTKPELVTELTVPVRPPKPPRPPAAPLLVLLDDAVATQSAAGRIVTLLAVTELGTV